MLRYWSIEYQTKANFINEASILFIFLCLIEVSSMLSFTTQNPAS